MTAFTPIKFREADDENSFEQMDTSFFIKAFAAAPSAVVPGYVIGGIAYFAIPW